MPVHMSRSPDLNSYIFEVVNSTKEWLEKVNYFSPYFHLILITCSLFYLGLFGKVCCNNIKQAASDSGEICI